MITIAEEPQDVLQVIDAAGEEFLAIFAEVMHEWGFADSPTPKCEPVRFPTLREARRVAAGRDPRRGWNVSPLS